MTLSPHTFPSILASGAALIALWMVVRFPRLGPSSVRVSIVNVAVAYLAGLGVAKMLIAFFAGLPVPGTIVLAMVGGALPPLVYLFTSIAWLFRSLQSLLPSRR